ncbi:uncharacterized protein LOC144159443 [Haemaphysalis longicornis]
MHPRSVVALAIVAIFAVTVILCVAVLWGPKRQFAHSQVHHHSSSTAHPPSVRATAARDGAAHGVVGSTAALPASATAAMQNSSMMARAHPATLPAAFHIVAASLGLFLVWLARTSGLLLPALIMLALLVTLLLPLGSLARSETGSSCGLSAICRLTEAARSNIQLRLEVAGLPEHYVKHLERLLFLLESLNCDRVEDSCPSLSLATILPF